MAFTRVLRSIVPRTARAFDTACALVLLLGVFIAANAARMPDGPGDFLSARVGVKNVIALALFLVLWDTSFGVLGLHQPRRWRLSDQAWRVIRATSMGTLPLLLFPLLSRDQGFRLEIVAAFWCAALVCEVVGRSLLTVAARGLASRAIGSVKLVVVGSGPRTLRLFERIQAEPLAQFTVVGFIDDPGPHAVAFAIRQRLLGARGDLESVLARTAVDQVLITLPVRSHYAEIQEAIETCGRLGVEVHYLSDVFDVPGWRATDRDDDLEATRHTFVTDDYRLVFKRAFDIVASAAGLLLLSPLLLTCAWLVRRSGPGPVFFSQVRCGHNRRLFKMFKFRTMVADAERLQSALETRNEASGPVFKIRDDPRVTPIGRLLRRASLDELPQLVNVLVGDMSIVGPRPLPMRDVSRFTEARLMRRFSVRPGITCLWQVNGRSNTDFDRWVEFDLEYIDNWSLALDARILLRTVPAVFTGAGAA